MPTLSEIMTAEVDALEPESSLREALETLRGTNISGAPVTANGALVGVVSVTDILEFQATTPGVPTVRPEQSEWGDIDAPEPWEEGDENPSAFFVDFWSDAGAELGARFEEPESPEWDLLDQHVVAEIMSRTVVTLPPDAEIRDAARLMLKAGVHRILVMEDGALRGIVTSTDVVRAVAEGIV